MTAKSRIEQPNAIIHLNRHLIGYSLSLSKGDKAILASLYGLASAKELRRLPASELILGRGQSMEKILGDVLDRAKSLGYKVSVCGNRKVKPVLRIWCSQEAERPLELTVSLGEILWSDSSQLWERKAPGTWALMERAFRGAGSRVVLQMRAAGQVGGGQVILEEGRAKVALLAVPSDAPAFWWEGELDLSQPGEWFEGSIGGGILGIQLRGTIRARRFPTLMRRLNLLAHQLQGEAAKAELSVCHLPGFFAQLGHEVAQAAW